MCFVIHGSAADIVGSIAALSLAWIWKLNIEENVDYSVTFDQFNAVKWQVSTTS